MSKSLNFPIARFVAKFTRRIEFGDNDDDVLDFEAFLCHGESLMLTCNFWVEVRLVNCMLEYIEDIFY